VRVVSALFRSGYARSWPEAVSAGMETLTCLIESAEETELSIRQFRRRWFSEVTFHNVLKVAAVI
jgi:hypothetical protein